MENERDEVKQEAKVSHLAGEATAREEKDLARVQ